MKNRLAIIALVFIFITVAGFALLSSRQHATTRGTSTNSAVVSDSNVNIQNYMFSPDVVRVKTSTTVTWTNQDSVNHTITADNASIAAPSSMDIPKGQTYKFMFTKPGTFTYHCFPHPYMHGTVIVSN